MVEIWWNLGWHWGRFAQCVARVARETGRVDSQRFDDLTRALAAGTTRRSVVKRLLRFGGAVGGAALIGAVGPGETTAVSPRPLGATCIASSGCASGTCDRRTRRCICSVATTNCAGTCTSLASDLANCGACGAVCPPGSVACRGGNCAFDVSLAGDITGTHGPLADDYLTIFFNDVIVWQGQWGPGPLAMTAVNGDRIRVQATNFTGEVSVRPLFLHRPADGAVQTLDGVGVPAHYCCEWQVYYDREFVVAF